MSELDDDPSGLPEPTDEDSDELAAAPLDMSGNPWAQDFTPQDEPITDREEILKLVNWCRDLQRELHELRALINQQDSTGSGIMDIRFNPTTKFIEVAFENPGVTWIPKIEFKKPCPTVPIGNPP